MRTASPATVPVSEAPTLRVGAALALGLALALPAAAQIATATVRGSVTAQNEAAGGAGVVATNLVTGYSARTSAGSDGNYVLPPLPPGRYRIVATAAGNAPTTQLITLRVGQNVSLDLALESQLAEVQLETVVVGARDNRNSEVGTNVSQAQIAALPQATRNFLAFADLAPGVAFTTLGDGSTQLRAGAQPSAGVNVYIDGVGQKNYVLQGGITGQDSSRGNPFPQSAIAEYRVITQNYKAEFDQVSSAAVSAVTKSGGNTFSGEAFVDHTTTAWRAATPAEQTAGRKVASREDQYGVALGGPIIIDRMHWFLAYEGKAIDTPKSVTIGQGRTLADLPTGLQGLVGPTQAAFKADLLFGKLDWSIDDTNLIELSVKLRREDETTNLGNQNTLPWSTLKSNDETRLDLRWQRSGADWVNDAHLSYENATFSPRARTEAPGYVLTTSDPNQVILNAGGGRDFQNKAQKGYALQNDLTLGGLEGYGSHVVKMGVKLKVVTLDAQERNPVNGQFAYDIGESTTDPFQVVFGAPLPGVGDGHARSRNTQLGLYAQDDWEVNKNLNFNLGLRWDYERSPAYLRYVTPPDVVAALRSFTGIHAPGSGVDIDDFISTGGNRKAFTGAWQPRLGFTLDLNADQRHVIFGGYARAYDRNLFDYLQLERTKATFPSYTFFFDTPAHDCAAAGTSCIAWDPVYYDPARLRALAGGTGAGREIDLLDNRLKTPRSDQLSLGMRHRVGEWNTELTVSRIESRDGFVFLLGNRRPDGSFFATNTIWGAPFGSTIPGFGSLLLGTNGLAMRSNALFFKVDRPYRIETGWGAALAYTFTAAKENREFNQRYALDYPSLDGYGWKRAGGVSRHRLVAVSFVDGPHEFVYSARLTLATAAPRYGTNCLGSPPDSTGCFVDQIQPAGRRFLLGGPIWGLRQLDLAVSKAFKVPGGTLRLRADLINVLNAKNYDGYNTWWGSDNVPNPDLGKPDGSLAGPTRMLKLGLAYAW